MTDTATMPTSTIELIGNTPLIAFEKIRPKRGRVVAKAEFMNPGGSMKDRAALHVIRMARERGDLREGQAVVEMTSGNMGAGLAVVCACYGHPFYATMSMGNSRARAKMMEGLGAHVVHVLQVDGSEGPGHRGRQGSRGRQGEGDRRRTGRVLRRPVRPA